jgi:putative ABC transport system permease protein
MRPAPFLTLLLSRLLPESERDALLGDLEEQFHLRRTREGDRAARRWYRRQLLASLRLTLSPASRHEPPPSRLFSLGDMLHELRFAARQLRRRPAHSLIVAFTLAVGIGATSAVLSVANPVLFRPLPYPDPDRVVLLQEVGRDGSVSSSMGYATFGDLRRNIRSLERSAAASWWTPVLMGDGEPEQLTGQSVTSEFFTVLGVAPALGRDFAPDEDAFERNRVVVLSHGLWQRRFGADPGIIGRSVRFGSTEYAVIGVLPGDFESLLNPQAQVWRPLGYNDTLPWACRTCRHLRTIARIRPDAEVTRVQAELGTEAARLLQDHPTQYAITGLRAERLHDNLVREVKPALLLMLTAGALVLAIACANVSNLVLARTAEREAEFAVRGALGAGPWRLIHQLTVESALLCLAGAAGGLLLARWGVTLLVAMSPASIPRLSAIALDWRVTLIILGVTLVVSLLVGLMPGLVALSHQRAPGGTRAITASRRRRRFTATLVVAEISLAFLLLFGAGILTRSLKRVLAVDPGFETRNLLTLTVVASGPRYQTDTTVWQMQPLLLDAIRAVPGVVAAGLTQQVPLGGNFDRYGVRIEDQPLANPEDAPSGDRYSVSPGYLETMGIPVLRGRSIEATDRGGSVPVALINETLARLAWRQESPIGKRIQTGGPDSPWRTIVGVVADVKHTGLDETPAPQFYIPTTQWPWADNSFVLVVRTTGPAAAAAPDVRLAIRSVDPQLAVSDVASADQRIATSTADRRLVLRLFEAFAAVALIMAAAGVYGLLSRRVAEQHRELGIRSALGATRRRIVGGVVRDGGRLAAAGVMLGGGAALALSRLLESLLFQITPGDPLTLVLSALLLGAVAASACLVPAWRAARSDPVEALRAE